MSVPPPSVKEQLHQLPSGYTEADGVSERARHRMLANGWHIGSARFLMMLVLQMLVQTPAANPQPQPRQSALQQMLSIVSRMEPSIGPSRWHQDPVCVAKASSMWEHWQLAKTSRHPLMREPQLEEGFKQCIEVQQLIGGSLHRMRAEIVSEIAEAAQDRMQETIQWWQSLPEHIGKVYCDHEHAQISQIPLLLELLDMTGMPDIKELKEDLQTGFQAFKKHNRHYAMNKLRAKRPDPEWETMQKELQSELEKGRMSGPYKGSGWWPVEAVSIDEMPLLQLQEDDICLSFCFSVRQTDKVRRCEDFRRSGHNATVEAHDVPHHHDIKVFTELALTLPSGQNLAKIWAQDLNGAYRQFPVREPNDCFCVLMTPRGPILLRHHALMFGAASSVWNFNRAADAITFLGRRLLATTVGH
eukprot:s2661_g10.t1